MVEKKYFWMLVVVCACWLQGCSLKGKNSPIDNDNTQKRTELTFDLKGQLTKCEDQLLSSLPKNQDISYHPRLIEAGEVSWKKRKNHILSWTVGFYPGILWYMYDATENSDWKAVAATRTEALEPYKFNKEHHDTGFMMYCSYGNGHRLTGSKAYKEVLLESAASLASRYNPNVGTIKSWSNKMHPRWSQHITIIDNMLNLELLYWAAKNGGGREYYNIATRHAETTMKNHFRPDMTSWHVIEYDSLTGKVLNRHTKQGYADDSRWARGQAWGIYGYTLVYRETGDKKFLDFAMKLTDKYLSMLPQDYVPYWDFDAPNIPNEERDASAAAVVASGLIELSTLIDDKALSTKYFNAAIRMLNSLSSDSYSGYGKSDAFLLHSTGAKPLGHEIDVALIYADYYYIEALLRLQELLQTS